MKAKSLSRILFAAALPAVVACSGGNGWKVSGTVEGAADSVLYVEGSTPGGWYVMDSITLGSDGSFSYRAQEAAETPSVFRLRLADKYIYFPVDSMEEVTVSAKLPAFDRGYRLAGNIYAAGFTSADSLVGDAIDARGETAALSDSVLKRNLNLLINRDTTCLVSYYIVGKTIAGRPLYSLTDKSDLRFLANAANNYKTHRPADPRATELEQRWMAGRQATGTLRGAKREAQLASRPAVNLKRYDMNGKEHDFDKVVTRGTGVTLLSFTRYTDEKSPALTAALRGVYDKYHAQGLEIFQVSYDANEVDWKRSAANMPWISVWNSPEDGTDALIAYNANVSAEPVTFVFNRAGELVGRVTDPAKLAEAIAKAQ